MFDAHFAKIEDAPVIAAIEHKSLKYEVREEVWDVSERELTDIWHQRLIQKEQHVIIAYKIEGEKFIPVGFIGLDGLIALGWIHALYIHPDYFHKGVGTYLVSLAESVVSQNGGKRLFLQVEPHNYGAMAFYTSCKFVKSRTKTRHLINMYKEL